MIRQIGHQDLQAYKALRLEMLAKHPESFGGSVEETKAMTDKDLLAWLGKSTLFGAFDNERLVGTAGFYTQLNAKTKHRGNLFGVYVAPDRRGKGVGDALMEAVIDHAKTVCLQIHASVTMGNDAAFDLYKRHGFESYAVEKRHIRVEDTFYDAHLVVKYLDA